MFKGFCNSLTATFTATYDYVTNHSNSLIKAGKTFVPASF